MQSWNINISNVNKTDDVVLTATTPPIADHSGTFISMNTLTFKKPPKNFIKYDYDATNWDGIDEKLTINSNMMTQLIYVKTLSTKWLLNFLKTLIKIRNDQVPHKSVTIHEKDKPWLDSTTKLK